MVMRKQLKAYYESGLRRVTDYGVWGRQALTTFLQTLYRGHNPELLARIERIEKRLDSIDYKLAPKPRPRDSLPSAYDLGAAARLRRNRSPYG